MVVRMVEIPRTLLQAILDRKIRGLPMDSTQERVLRLYMRAEAKATRPARDALRAKRKRQRKAREQKLERKKQRLAAKGPV